MHLRSYPSALSQVSTLTKESYSVVWSRDDHTLCSFSPPLPDVLLFAKHPKRPWKLTQPKTTPYSPIIPVFLLYTKVNFIIKNIHSPNNIIYKGYPKNVPISCLKKIFNRPRGLLLGDTALLNINFFLQTL